MKHPTPIEIEEHVLRKGADSLGLHLESCEDCARTARMVRAFVDPLSWSIASLCDHAKFAMGSGLEGENEVTSRLRAAEELRHVDPSKAVEICDEVLALPDCSRDSEEARHYSVLALRERANALRVLGQLEDALDSVSRARRLASEMLVGDFENAILDFIEATILYRRDETDRVLKLAKRAETTLSLFGDVVRAHKVRFLAGCVEHTRGNFESAHKIFLGVLDSADEAEEPAIVAGLLNNIADCEVSLGRFEQAQAHIARAAELYRQRHMHTELIRLAWLEARIALGQGDLGRAETLLLEADSGFAESGLDLDAADVSLDLLELYESQGRRDDVVRVATRLASIFAEAGAKMSLATTLATLRDAAVRGEDLKTPILTARNTIEELMAQG